MNGVTQPTQTNSDSRFLGSLDLVHQLNDTPALRANVSQGYNYPSLSQIFLTSVGAGGTVIGNLVLDTVLFYTNSEDYIASLATGIPRQWRYENVDAAQTWGVKLPRSSTQVDWAGHSRTSTSQT